MKTVALLLMASTALPWIWAWGGRTPFASLVMMDLGRLRSCGVDVKTRYRITPYERNPTSIVRASLSAFSLDADFSCSFFSELAFVVAGVEEAAAVADADLGVGCAAVAGAEAEAAAAAAAAEGVAGVAAAAVGAEAEAGVDAGSSSMTAKRAFETSLLRLASLLRGGIV